jgi:uncharacterized protein YkwD
MGRRTALLACLTALLVGVFSPGAVQSAVGSQSTRSVASLEGGVLAELNTVRAAHGLRPLRLNAELSAAARQHTSEMLTDGYFEHESFDGSAFWKRIKRFYGPGAGSWSVGENLLWSSNTLAAKRAVELWMASPGHRENILNRSWREIGIAALYSGTSSGTFGGGPVTLVTTDFGVRG